MSERIPAGDAPPSYDMATGSSTNSKQTTSHLEVPGNKNGIPPAARRSMEDEHRPLPAGWVRQWDDREQHQFFVDTKADPPRSTWVHPYDDETYLSTLTSEQRERIQEDERERQIALDHTDDEAPSPSKAKMSAQNTGSSSFPQDLPSRTARPGSTSTPAKGGFSEKLKQKVTGQTKEERAQLKAQREKEEREYYEAHIKFRQAMQQAQMTGQPVWFARDPQGHDVYVEPPRAYGGGYGPYANNGYGVSPYQSGPYANPNARFIRPPGAYNRPYGGRPGGGYGMPIAGGLLGGMLLGGLMF